MVSSGGEFGLSKAIEILTWNQYPLSFIEPIIKSTLNKLLGCPDEDDDSDSESNLSLDSNACYSIIEDLAQDILNQRDHRLVSACLIT